MSILTKILDIANKIGTELNLYSRKIDYRLNTEIKTRDTWIDGKPIYTIAIKSQTSASASLGLAYTFNNLDTLISLEAFIRSSDTDNWYPISYYNGDLRFSWFIDIRSGQFYTTINKTYHNKPLFIVAKYTKTTDTATISI